MVCSKQQGKYPLLNFHETCPKRQFFGNGTSVARGWYHALVDTFIETAFRIAVTLFLSTFQSVLDRKQLLRDFWERLGDYFGHTWERMTTIRDRIGNYFVTNWALYGNDLGVYFGKNWEWGWAVSVLGNGLGTDSLFSGDILGIDYVTSNSVLQWVHYL